MTAKMNIDAAAHDTRANKTSNRARIISLPLADTLAAI
jgi:hypothetical protein